MRFHVQLSYSTEAETPEEALRMALGAIGARGGYAEVYPEVGLAAVIEGDTLELLGEGA